jgi:hypothetical protein
VVDNAEIGWCVILGSSPIGAKISGPFFDSYVGGVARGDVFAELTCYIADHLALAVG